METCIFVLKCELHPICALLTMIQKTKVVRQEVSSVAARLLRLSSAGTKTSFGEAEFNFRLHFY